MSAHSRFLISRLIFLSVEMQAQGMPACRGVRRQSIDIP
jgi:hypothetical protein